MGKKYSYWFCSVCCFWESFSAWLSELDSCFVCRRRRCFAFKIRALKTKTILIKERVERRVRPVACRGYTYMHDGSLVLKIINRGVCHTYFQFGRDWIYEILIPILMDTFKRDLEWVGVVALLQFHCYSTLLSNIYSFSGGNAYESLSLVCKIVKLCDFRGAYVHNAPLEASKIVKQSYSSFTITKLFSLSLLLLFLIQEICVTIHT